MSKLSVIICLYNTEKTMFEQSLNSVLNSSISSDIEYIIVNDGSTFNYDEIKIKYPKFKWVETKNHGTLSARLTGVKNATSPFVFFMDSDDEISFIYLEALLKKQEKTNSDITIGDWAFQTQSARYYCGNDSTINSKIFEKDEMCLKKYFEKAGMEHSYYVLWNKLFKRELLLKSCEKIENLDSIFDTKIVFGEDVLITYFAFSMAKCITNIHFGYYFYKIHNSQQTCISSKQTLVTQIENMKKVFKYIEYDLKSIGRFDELKQNLLDWKKLLSSSNYEIAKNSNYLDLFDFIKISFNQQKLTKLSSNAHKVYANHKLLPSNLDEISEVLKKIYYNNSTTIYSSSNSFSLIQALKLKKIFNKDVRFTLKENADIILLKDAISFKLKLIHNDLFYKIGTKLFPKGSKIRKFLKSKL